MLNYSKELKLVRDQQGFANMYAAAHGMIAAVVKDKKLSNPSKLTKIELILDAVEEVESLPIRG